MNKIDTGDTNQKYCELCGTPVKIVGNTTLHYEPIKEVQEWCTCKEPEIWKNLTEVENRRFSVCMVCHKPISEETLDALLGEEE